MLARFMSLEGVLGFENVASDKGEGACCWAQGGEGGERVAVE